MRLRGLLFFLLLYVVNDIHFKISTGVPGLAPFNILFLIAYFGVRGGEPDTITIEEPILRKPLFYFFGMLGFSLLWAQVRAFNDILSDLTVFKNACFYPLYYFLFLHCKQDLKWTRLLILWIMVIASVAGLEAFREGLDYGILNYNPHRRASGPFGDDWAMSNTAGVFYAMFLPMLTAVALFMKGQKTLRLGAVGGMILITAGTLFTYSRQSYFICLVSTALLLVRRSIIAAAVICAALVSMVGFLPDTVTQRVVETKQEDKQGKEEVDESTSSRWEIWAGALEMSKHNPIGVGLDRFKGEIGNYSSHKGMDAHNFYVRTLAEYGPQGVLVLLILLHACYRLTKFLRKNVPKDNHEADTFAIGFTVTTLCTVLGNVYGSRFLDGPVMGCYWALAGLLERSVHLRLAETKSVDVQAPNATSIEERFPLAAYARGRGNRV